MSDPKHRRFIAEYLKDQKGGPAAVRAGYSKRSADQIASRLLRNDKVRAAIDARLEKITKDAGITKERILQSLLNIAEFDPRKLFNTDGTVKAMSDLPNEVALVISGLDSDDADGEIKKFKFCDKVKALELLGKHVKLFDETLPLSGIPMVLNIVPADNSQARDQGH